MIHIASTPQQLAHDVAEWIVAEADAAIVARGRFLWVASGGSTSRLTYETLAQAAYRDRVDWERVYVFWGDERTVPPDHPDSNYGMTQQALLQHVPLVEDHIFRMKGEDDPLAAAADYEAQIRAVFADVTPRFDVILLGMGADGHTASLFPNTAALNETDRLVMANFVAKLGTWRITLTEPLLNLAQNVAFIVAGEDKATTLQAVLHGPYDPQQLPSQLIRDPLWFVDNAAASKLNK